MIKKISPDLWIVKKKDARYNIAPDEHKYKFDATYYFLVQVVPSNFPDLFAVKCEFTNAENKSLELIIHKAENNELLGAGNRIPFLFPLQDARKVAASIANSELAFSF